MRRALMNDPDHWFARKEEAALRLAEEMGDEYARDTMLRIAEGYDRLAKQAENNLLTIKPKKEK